MNPEEINELVAKKLGWKFCPCIGGPHEKEHRAYMPLMNHELLDYCHSIEEAWEILNYVASHNGAWDLEFDNDNRHVLCTLKPSYIEARAATAPMAICLAFLKLDGDAK